MSDMKHVCSVDELDEGEHIIIDYEGIEVGVIKVKNGFYAISNHCPHQGGPVCEGRIKNKREVSSCEPGERIEIELSDQKTISCPKHGWEYDLETGEHLGDPDITVPTFKVKIKNNEIYVTN